MNELRIGGWYYYLSGQEDKLEEHKCGKWMHFFTDQTFAQGICKKAIKEGVCYECKCSDMALNTDITGVICFYCNGDDIENHKRIISFMLENNLIRTTRTGKYYNISYKFDEQTDAGEYGDDFTAKITLNRFIDLNTGEWIYKEA